MLQEFDLICSEQSASAARCSRRGNQRGKAVQQISHSGVLRDSPAREALSRNIEPLAEQPPAGELPQKRRSMESSRKARQAARRVESHWTQRLAMFAAMCSQQNPCSDICSIQADARDCKQRGKHAIKSDASDNCC